MEGSLQLPIRQGWCQVEGELAFLRRRRCAGQVPPPLTAQEQVLAAVEAAVVTTNTRDMVLNCLIVHRPGTLMLRRRQGRIFR
jgi:hypothetical protein